MSWCGRCFASQTDSDSDSDDEGEYEYFVDSHYICKRKKTEGLNGAEGVPLRNMNATESSTRSESYSSSLSQSSAKGRRHAAKMSSTTDDTSQSGGTEQKLPFDSPRLKGARVWQVGHVTVHSPASPHDNSHQTGRPLAMPSGSNSEGTSRFLPEPRSLQQGAQNKILPSTDHWITKNKSDTVTTSTTTSVTTDCISALTVKSKKPGFIRRLFGKSADTRYRSSSFKEAMEKPSPSVPTNTLYWTVRVKLK